MLTSGSPGHVEPASRHQGCSVLSALRGFGDNRFLDTGRILLHVEERMRLFAVTYRDMRTALELALFVEAGRVFHTFADAGTGKVQTVLGARVRLVAASQIVVKIDVGFGSESVIWLPRGVLIVPSLLDLPVYWGYSTIASWREGGSEGQREGRNCYYATTGGIYWPGLDG